MLDARFRTAVDKLVGPAGRALRRTGLSPDHLTAAGIVMSVPAAWAIATGRLGLGLVLFIASALPDLFDGSLAKASGRASRRGAFFDSVGDRVSDSAILVGMAWYAQDRFGGHAALVPMGVLGASQLVSYIRAKADALGVNARGGLMERGERVIVLCLALVLPSAMLWLLGVVLVLSLVTAGQRFVKVWRLAGKPPEPLPVEPTAVVLRWRAWREERASRDPTWWARAPRGSAGTQGGFSSGSRRPGGGATSRRWHEHRYTRRRGPDDTGSGWPGAAAGARGPGASDVATRERGGPAGNRRD